MQKLAGNVYIETSFPGVNVGAVVTKEGTICIDAPTHPGDAQKWRQKLRELSAKPILYVINTDHHRDRILGNHWFNAPVIAHDYTAERVRLYPEIVKGGVAEPGSGFEPPKEMSGVRIISPQITFSEELLLLKGGQEIVIRHMPGFTPGAAWVLLPKTGVVFTGDSVVVATHPFLGEADLERWLACLAELCRPRFPAKTIVPGRGKATNKQGVKGLQKYLKLVQRKMQKLIQSKGPRGAVAAMTADLLKQYRVPESQREGVSRRLRQELERMYDELRGEA